MTAASLLPAESDFSVPEVLQIPFSIYRNKASTWQHKLSVPVEEWGFSSIFDKFVTAGCSCRLNFSWFKVQLHSSGMVFAGWADAHGATLWQNKPWICHLILQIVLHLAHSYFPRLLDPSGILLGETLLLLPSDSVASAGSTCSPQQMPLSWGLTTTCC